MARVLVSFRPNFFAPEKSVTARRAFGYNEAFKSCQPMVIITSAIIGLATLGHSSEFTSESTGPFFPGEIALPGKLNRERKGLSLPGFVEHWTL